MTLGLPDENGHGILKKLRNWYTKPIIILSVQSNEDILKALIAIPAGIYCTIKKKVEANANRPEHILTESGVGYRFIAKE